MLHIHIQQSTLVWRFSYIFALELSLNFGGYYTPWFASKKIVPNRVHYVEGTMTTVAYFVGSAREDGEA
jgi:hypothetical protein